MFLVEVFFSFFRLHTDRRVDFLGKWMPPSSSVGSITPSKQSKLVLIFQNKKARLRLGPLQAADWLFRKNFCVRLIIKPLSQIMSHGFWLNGLFPEKSSFQNKMVPVRHQESMGVKGLLVALWFGYSGSCDGVETSRGTFSDLLKMLEPKKNFSIFYQKYP